MNIEHANRIPMAEVLSKLSIHPKWSNANKQVYPSPLQRKKTARLKVNTNTNRWYDQGIGIGGGSVDFVCAYLKSTHEAHTEADALRWLKNMVVWPAAIPVATDQATDDFQTDSDLRLKTKKPIQQQGLIYYLEKQGIPLTIAQRYLKEVRVYNSRTKQHFIALGFPNEEGGLALKNPFFNGCVGSNAITFIRGRKPKPASIHLFADVIDYLSAISRFNRTGFTGDTIVLNSLSCLSQISAYIQNYGYRTAYSWFDNDAAGEKATQAFTQFCQTQANLVHKPMNRIYAPHKDVNAWHMHRQGSVL